MKKVKRHLATLPPNDPEAQRLYPYLFRLCTQTVYRAATKDGKPKQVERFPAMLVIRYEMGSWNASVIASDPNEGLQISAVSETLPGVFLALERALTSENPPWRKAKKGKGRERAEWEM